MMEDEMSETKLKVWTNGCDYVIAESVDEIGALMAEHQGPGYVPDPNEEWVARDDGKLFTYYPECDRDGESVTKTFVEWAAERGRGYFACSEF